MPPAANHVRMAFRDFVDREPGARQLQRSLERGRLAHAYLFIGARLQTLETVAQTLAKTLSCLRPTRAGGVAVDCCDQCANCRKTEHGNHADVHWVRPESKSRVILVEQIRELIREINLKPTEGGYKTAIIVAADRLKTEAANAFLKTLEEPPEKSALILLTTEASRVLETIRSRCLRVTFSGDDARALEPAQAEWLERFCEMAAAEQKSLMGRYRLMDVLLQKLSEIKAAVETELTARSPLQQYDDVEKDLREKWETELAAGIEAEYRRQRAELLLVLQRWLRDIWLLTLGTGGDRLQFPELAGEAVIARRLGPNQALSNLDVIERTQRLLHTNVQEALALEVGLLKLQL